MSKIDFSVRIILYILFISGLIIIFRNSFLNLYGWLSLRKNLISGKKQYSESPVFEYLSMLCFASFGKEKMGKTLFCFLIIVFSLSFAFSFIYFKFLISIIIAILCTSIPFLSLVSKVLKDRNRSSKESIAFLSDLYRVYRIENQNIYATMEKVLLDKNNFPICAKYLYMLCLHLRSAGSKTHIKECCNDFAKALNSAWGKSLAVCIESSCSGVDVSAAILEILSQLKMAKENEEERKRLNSESFRMTVFLVPALYAVTILISVKYLGVPISRLVENQFLNAEGLFFFLVIVLLFSINLLVINFITDSKLDI